MIPLFAAILAASSWVSAPTPAEAVDVYTTPGLHNVNGRQWKTDCTQYSSTVTRCRTEIVATQITLQGGRYVSKTGWVFNNLTYLPSARSQWAGNPLAISGEHTLSERRWLTECDTPRTGANACRSYIWTNYITSAQTPNGWVHSPTSGWVFNNIVKFSSDYWLRVSGYGDDVVRLPAGISLSTVTAEFSPRDRWDGLTVLGLNAYNEEVDYPLIGTEAPVSTGWFNRDEDVRSLSVEADGRWTLTVKPLSTAREFDGYASGNGPDVLWYMGPPRTAALSHTGDSNFIVRQITDDDWKSLANEIGDYFGYAAMLSGPALIEVDADGDWSIS